MRYDVVIATLNRPASLRACATLIEAQTERPVRVVIVDASDDHDSVRSFVMQDRDPSIDWRFVKSDQRSSPYQRNLGLTYVEQDVVLFPDDDSMLFPDAAMEMMAAYRADCDRRVASVSAVGVASAPSQLGEVQIARSRALKDRMEGVRTALEGVVVHKPFATYPHSLLKERSVPEWIDGSRFVVVPSVGGYRLSLRADVVRENPFDEVMGYGIGYALHEDMELSIRLQRKGYLLVAAQRAAVFHDVHPSRRAGGFNYGFCWIANYIYACRRNIPEASPAWTRHLPGFMRYKLGLYRIRALMSRDQYSSDVLKGARAAWAVRGELMHADPAEVGQAYMSMCDRMILK